MLEATVPRCQNPGEIVPKCGSVFFFCPVLNNLCKASFLRNAQLFCLKIDEGVDSSTVLHQYIF